MTRGDSLLITAGVTLGVGLGGFVDGILFHQILQWHEMLSSVVPPVDVVALKVNMLWDGLFHAVMWIATVSGVVVLVRTVGREHHLPIPRTFVSALFVGWGVFNVVEGLIDHQILRIHHVHPGVGQLAWDLAYLVVGAVVALIGALVLLQTVGAEARREPLPA